MTQTAKPTPSPQMPRPAMGDALDAPAVLAKARRILWTLKVDGQAVDVQAADAVTHHRHGEAGRRFAERIILAVGPGAGQAVIDAAIRQELTGGGQ